LTIADLIPKNITAIT